MSEIIRKPLRIVGNKIVYSENPIVYVILNYLTDEECDHFINLARDKVTRSTAVGGDFSIYHPSRTSMNCWVKHDTSSITQNISNRISHLVNFPLKRAEDFQVVYYTDGTEYKPHFDAFDHKTDIGKKHLQLGGQRICTALAYLNDVKEGGATEFPDLRISFKPIKKALVVWENVISGTTDAHPMSRHAGRPVTKGEKFAFNLWFRAREFK